MRTSEMQGKEVIDVLSGERLGVIKDIELLLNLNTGMVEALILIKHGFSGRSKETQTIPWQQIRKISDDLILIESKPE